MGNFWRIVETRPFMRAKSTYAMDLEKLGFIEEALEQYVDLLELNPGDNRGKSFRMRALKMV